MEEKAKAEVKAKVKEVRPKVVRGIMGWQPTSWLEKGEFLGV